MSIHFQRFVYVIGYSYKHMFYKFNTLVHITSMYIHEIRMRAAHSYVVLALKDFVPHVFKFAYLLHDAPLKNQQKLKMMICICTYSTFKVCFLIVIL